MSELILHFFDVGHGDSIVGELPDQKSYFIIDCNRRHGINPAHQFFSDLITQQGGDFRVSFACLSHPHSDHFRGFGEVIQLFVKHRVPILEFWDFNASRKKLSTLISLAQDEALKSDCTQLEELYEVVLDICEGGGCSYRPVASPTPVWWRGSGVEIEAIAPDAHLALGYSHAMGLKSDSERISFLKKYPYAGNDNIVSSAFLLKFGEFRALLGGDVVSPVWQRTLKKNSTNRIHVAKASHHGSNDGNYFGTNCEPILTSAFPESSDSAIIVSGGYRHGLPSEKFVADMEGNQTKVYCTGPGQFEGLVPLAATRNDLEASLFGHSIFQIVEATGMGCGHISVKCYPDGRFQVNTENNSPIAID